MSKIRIVQVNEKAYIVQELGTLFFFPKWWTWQEGSMDATWDQVHTSQWDAVTEIEKTLERRKRLADAKAFQKKVIWP